MTRSLFEKTFMALVAAKLQAPDPDFIKAKRDVYWTQLKDIPDSLWEKGVGYYLKHGIYFPQIEELAEASIGIKYDYPSHPKKEKIPWEKTLDKILSRRKIEDREQKRSERGVSDSKALGRKR